MYPSKTPASTIALGGVMAALAVTIMCFGGLIPVATFVSPMLCIILLQVILNLCGRRIAWAWYGAVAILGILLSPDKEAAAVFVFFGYYPIVKPIMDRAKLSAIWKILLFNISVIVMYWLLLRLFGLSELESDFDGISGAMAAVLLGLGNITFFLLDKLLGMEKIKRLGRRG